MENNLQELNISKMDICEFDDSLKELKKIKNLRKISLLSRYSYYAKIVDLTDFEKLEHFKFEAESKSSLV